MLAASDCLPKTLRSLTVSQVDMKTCIWVQDMLVHSSEHFADFKDIRFIFREDALLICPTAFDQTVWRAGVTMTGQWKDEESVMI